MKSALKILLLLVLLIAANGCGGARFDNKLAQEKRELGELYDWYLNYAKSHESPPADLSQADEDEITNSAGLRAVKDGKYTVVWNLKTRDAATILAYEPAAPTQGGIVLLANGAVRKMTADEFKRAKPAS